MNGHFHPTTMETVLAHSGPLWKTPQRHKRYVIWPTPGYGIRPGSTSNPSHGNPAATWSVLDSNNEWRDVAHFVPHGGSTEDTRYAKAQALADRLNAEDKAAA